MLGDVFGRSLESILGDVFRDVIEATAMRFL